MLSTRDACALAWQAITAQRVRALLIGLATAIGVAAVVLLTALGDGARRYIVDEFSALGTNLLIVLPGRNETVGGPPPLMGETPRDLTLGDSDALARDPYAVRVAPLMVGSANVSTAAGLEREATLLGATADFAEVRQLAMDHGRFLPSAAVDRATSVCVLGPELASELFPQSGAVGRWVRIGDRRFRVLGVLASTGVSIGQDFDEMAIIPVASAQILLDTEGLFRILVEARPGIPLANAAEAVRETIKARHEGEDDVTVITQDSVIATFDRILNTLTLAVAGVSAISLVVAGILTMNVMLVAVAQRRTEIGLCKAVGARLADIRRLFLWEAVLLTASGAVAGVALGYASAFALRQIYPAFPAFVPLWGTAAAVLTAGACGIAFGVLPASRAARLDPVQALSRRG